MYRAARAANKVQKQTYTTTFNRNLLNVCTGPDPLYCGQHYFLIQRDLLFANCPIPLETEVTELLSYFLFTFLSHSPTATHCRSTCPCVSFSHIHYVLIQGDLEIQKANYFLNGAPLLFGEIVSLTPQNPKHPKTRLKN